MFFSQKKKFDEIDKLKEFIAKLVRVRVQLLTLLVILNLTIQRLMTIHTLIRIVR